MSKKTTDITSQPRFEALKQADPDRYRAALLAPSALREDLLCLYGFHYELAKVPEWVSEPMVGEIRYQWWRDCIDEIYTNKPVRKHEIATPLVDVIKRAELPRFWMDSLINGRARDLDPAPFPSLEACLDYSSATSGVLMALAVKLCAPNLEISPELEASIKASGQAWGLTGLLRGYRYYHDSMLSEVKFETLLEALPQIMAEARAVRYPAEIMPALAYGGLVKGFKKRLTRKTYDPTQDVPSYSGVLKHLSISKTGLKGKF